MKEIAALVIGIIAILLYACLSIFKIGRTKLLIGIVLVNCLWLVHYLLLGALSGMLSCAILSIMSIAYFLRGKTKFLSSLFVPIIFVILNIIIFIVSYDGVKSFLCCVGSVLLAVGLWFKKEVYIKYFTFLCSLFYVCYNAMVGTTIGVIFQGISLVLNLFFVILHWKEFVLIE